MPLSLPESLPIVPFVRLRFSCVLRPTSFVSCVLVWRRSTFRQKRLKLHSIPTTAFLLCHVLSATASRLRTRSPLVGSPSVRHHSRLREWAGARLNLTSSAASPLEESYCPECRQRFIPDQTQRRTISRRYARLPVRLAD